MEKRKIKLLPLIITISLISTMVGCGKKKVSTDLPTINYVTFGVVANVQDGRDAVQEKLNTIASEKIGAKINLQIVETSMYEQQMTVKLASGENVDLFFTAPWFNNYANLVARNALLELDTLLPEHAKEYYDSIPKEWWDCTKINGKIYAAINQQIFARQNAFIFRESAINKTGFDWENCTTVEGVGEFMKLAKENGYDTKQYQLFGANIIDVMLQYWEFETIGASVTPGVIKYHNNGDIKVFNQYETEEFKSYINLTREWNKNGLIPKDALSSTVSLTSLSKMDPCYKPGFTEAAATIDFEGDKALVKRFGDAFLSTSNVTATMLGVAKTSKNPEKTVELINLINTDKEFYNTLCFGIEGVDYEKIDDVTVKVLDSRKYTMNDIAWALGNQFNAYLLEGSEKDAWERQEKMNREGVYSEVLGFTFDETNVQNEVANCKAVSSEYVKPFLLGFYDIDERYPEFIKKLKDAGADKIIAEKQRQIDEFIKNR